MLFRQSEKKDSDEGLLKLPSQPSRVHSIAAMSRRKEFKGSFEVGSSSYTFTYAPAKASIIGRRLQLQGHLAVKDAGGQTRTRDPIRATLVATQGGIGAAPTRPGNPASGAPASNLPDVESTGVSSFTGVLYLELEPLSGNPLGVSGDLARVQLNVRFAPVDDSERALQAAYSSIIASLHGKNDAKATANAIDELNKLLAAG
ncbi:MAG TPA: hypothetical protein VKF81_15545 [Blastocatellia bacterium]|nr:hypothetical protein [Blastocatellia bacterium]